VSALDFFLIIIGYLLGSISFSIVIARMVKGIDIRDHGSGNAGATNTLRVLGRGPGALVLTLDILKGVLAVLFAKWFGSDELEWIPAATALAAITGHSWPVFFGFKGGKGVATTAGVMLTLSFFPALISFAVALLTMAITRYVSLGSLIGTALIPILMGFWGANGIEVSIAVIIFAIVAFRHRSNIVKLLNGTENKLGQRK
jgi:glycerol-3-phosphate acyltransferase PlsY